MARRWLKGETQKVLSVFLRIYLLKRMVDTKGVHWESAAMEACTPALVQVCEAAGMRDDRVARYSVRVPRMCAPCRSGLCLEAWLHLACPRVCYATGAGGKLVAVCFPNLTGAPMSLPRDLMSDPGIFALPLRRLWPYLSLWTMHVWIYWFNTSPLRERAADDPWWLGIYGVMTLLLLGVACAWRARPAQAPTGRFDLPMTCAMCACTLSVVAAGTTGIVSSWWSGANVAVAGVCMGWGYLRWSTVFSDLGIRDAVGCLFGSYLLGSTLKVAFDVAPAMVGALLALCLPIVSLISLRLVARDPWGRPEEQRGEVLYREGSYASLVRAGACVAAFCLARRVAAAAISDGGSAWVISLVSHVIEVGFAIVALAWVFQRNRSLDFPQLWRFVFLFLATTIAADCLGLPATIAKVFSGVTTSLIVMLLWLLLSDVAHHCDRHPYVVFGLGWSLYVGGDYAGSVLAHVLGVEAMSPELGVVLLWATGVVMALCLETSDSDVQRIFADLRRRVAPEEFASIDERCARLAGEFSLTERELDVLKMLAKGRSKGYIAEELYISENTVRGHSRRLYAKLGVHTRDELQRKLGL